MNHEVAHEDDRTDDHERARMEATTTHDVAHDEEERQWAQEWGQQAAGDGDSWWREMSCSGYSSAPTFSHFWDPGHYNPLIKINN